MSRNASGTFTLVAGNPVITNTDITSNWANTTMPDIAEALTDSLSRSGKGGMTAALRGVDGTVALPAFSFTNFPDQGLYSAASGDVRMSVAGVDQMRWQNNQTQIWDTTDSAWRTVITDGNVYAGPAQTYTLTSGQTVQVFASSVAGASIRVNGPDCDNGVLVQGIDYTVAADDVTLTLTSSYPAGTLLTAQRSVEDTAAAEYGELVYDTVADLQAASLPIGSWVTTKGYYTAGDGGGANYLVAINQAVDGYGSHNMANSNVALIQCQDIVELPTFGTVGDGTTDDSAAVKACHDWAKTNGYRYVMVPFGSYEVTSATQISDVVWVGDGQFIGQLREKVHSSIRHGADVQGDILPKRHLRRLSLVDSPVVAIIGDSLATETPSTTFDESESLWGVLQRRFEEDNPDLSFTFENRAIGESTWTQCNPSTNLNTTGLTLPSWAGSGADPWLDYVESLDPDVVIFNFGMNDRQNFVTAQFRAVMTGILAWTKVPDILFVTPMVPSRQSANADISSEVSQEGRDFVAGYLRTYANYMGFGFIDVNRQYDIVREGFDPTMSKLFRNTSTAVSTTLGYTAPAGTECADFGWSLDFTNIPAGFWTGLGSGNLRFYISPYPSDFPNSTTWVNIIDDAGNIQIQVVDVDDVSGTYIDTTTSVTTPTTGSDFTLTLFVKGGYLSVKLDDEVVYEGTIRRNGGQFLPKVEFTDGYSPSVDLFYYKGTYNDFLPRMTDAEMWGDGSTGNTGGNDLNHPTSDGWATVIWPVLSRTDLRAPVVIEGNTDYASTTERKAGIRKWDPKGILHIMKTAAGDDQPSTDANMLVLEDAAAAGMSILTDNTGVGRIFFGDEDDTAVAGLAYDHNLDKFSFKINGTGNAIDFTDSLFQAKMNVRFQAENNSGATDTANRSITFDLTSDTNLRLRVRGNDGTVRTADITLA